MSFVVKQLILKKYLMEKKSLEYKLQLLSFNSSEIEILFFGHNSSTSVSCECLYHPRYIVCGNFFKFNQHLQCLNF